MYIWPAHWTIAKVIFLANRYLNLVFMGTMVAQEAGFIGGSSQVYLFLACI